MTDNEIIKALECCVSFDHETCDICPFEARCKNYEQLDEYALDLINRQQAEIERAEKLLDDKCDRCIEQDRKQAIKEYKERVKQALLNKGFYPVFVKNALDEVVKEMVGD